VDWDERSIRVVEASLARSSVRLRKAVHVPLPPGVNPRDPAAMGEFMSRTLREHRIRTRRVLVPIPRQDVILNLLSLPPGTGDEMAAMVHGQVVKELPFSKDQAVIDFAVTREEGAKTCEVWVAAIRTHIIDYYRQTIEEAGLSLERIGLRPYANQAAVVEGGDVAGRTVLVDIGPSMTEINILRDTRLVYSRAASVSVAAAETGGVEELPAPGDQTIPLADDFLPKQGPLDALLIEVSRTIQAYRATDPGARIDRIVLSGSGGVDERVREAFARRFGTPTKLFECPKSLQWNRVTEASAAPFMTVIGVALTNLAAETARFDFLHPKEPEAEKKERARKIPMAAAVVALFLAAGGVFAIQTLRIKQGKVDEVAARRKTLEAKYKERTPLLDKYKDVNDWKTDSAIWVDQIKLLADSFVPNKQAYITRFSANERGEISIELATADTSVCAKLADTIRQISTKDEKGNVVHPFEAEVQTYRPDPKNDPQYPYDDALKVLVKRLKPEKKK
jgi:type IV pilus assembly protein PilM